MIFLAAAMMLAGGGADLRHDFVACLKTASVKAQTQKIAADGFVDFARTTCAGAADPFKAMLVDANIKHGMSRKESASDAESQLKDYYSEWHDKYAEDAPAPAAVKPAQPPAPTPASQPTTPQ